MLSILNASQIMYKGLEAVGFDRRSQERTSHETRLERFVTHFGANPHAYAQIWQDLQTTTNPAARINPKKARLLVLLAHQRHSHW